MTINSVVVIGAGIMGAGISQLSILAGYDVTLVDIKEEYIQNGITKITEGMKKLESKNKLGGRTTEDMMSTLKTSIDLPSAVKNADFVIEVVVEIMDIKKQVFKTVADNAPAHCIIATNTSSMSISEIAEASGRPEKCCGIHFFNPPPLMRLIEVIKGEKTEEETLKVAKIWSLSLPCLRGKRYVPIVLKDRPGFIVNRINAPTMIYLSWALDYAKENNIPFEHVSADIFNPMIPMDGLVLLDYVGLDTAVHTMEYYKKTLDPEFEPGIVLKEKIEKNRLGAKSKRGGIYKWRKGKPPILERTFKANIITLEVLAAIQANEACRVLEEGIVTEWTTIDASMLAGSNAAGPMGFLYDGNHDRWIKLLNEVADKTGKEYFRPCELMKSKKYRQMRV